MSTTTLAGVRASTNFTQDKGRRLTSFHFEAVEDGLVEFTICTYDADMKRHEFITNMDRQQMTMVHDMLAAYMDWYRELDERKKDDA